MVLERQSGYNLIFYTMLKEQETVDLHDPFEGILVQGVQEFVKYEKEIGEGYKSKQEKTKERVQKLIRHVHEDRKEKRKHRRETDLKKLKEVLSTMTEAQARAYLDGIKAKKKEKKERVRNAMATGQMMILDLAYEGKMNEKENKSLGNQIQLIMKAIKNAADPPSIHLCGFKGGIRAQMERMRYQHWALTAHEEDVSIFGTDFHERLIYLSPDAQEALDTVSKEDIFILGGLIDRTVLKDASVMRAKELGVKAKRLPITQYMKGRACLNLDHVVSMICRFKETGDWKAAFDFAAPKRWRKEEGKGGQREESSQESGDSKEQEQKYEKQQKQFCEQNENV